MHTEARISPSPEPDVRAAIEQALAKAGTADGAARRSAWWYAGLDEGRTAGAADPLGRRVSSPARPRARGRRG